MASKGGEVKRKHFVFANCPSKLLRRRRLLYFGFARVAGFPPDDRRGTMVVDITLHPHEAARAKVKRAASKRTRSRKSRTGGR